MAKNQLRDSGPPARGPPEGRQLSAERAICRVARPTKRYELRQALRRENIKPTLSPEQLEARVLAWLGITPEQLRTIRGSAALRVLSEAGSTS